MEQETHNTEPITGPGLAGRLAGVPSPRTKAVSSTSGQGTYEKQPRNAQINGTTRRYLSISQINFLKKSNYVLPPTASLMTFPEDVHLPPQWWAKLPFAWGLGGPYDIHSLLT